MNLDLTRNDLAAIKGLLDEEHFDAAGNLLNAYLTRYPDDEMALFLLGRLMLETNKPAIGLAVLQGLEDTSNWAIQYCLGRAKSMLHKQYDAIEHYLKANDISPGNVNVMHGLSCSFVELRDGESAVKWANRVLDLDPNHALAKANIGYAALQDRDYGLGWEMYDYGIGNLTSRPEKVYHGEPAWDGRKGMKLAVYSDQGLGDQIAGVEPLRDAMADNEVVCLEVDPKLRNLFARNFPEIPVHGAECPADVDFHANLFTLHRHYRKSETAYPKKPYLTPHPELATMWGALFKEYGTPVIGVAWSGGIPATHAYERRCYLDALLPVFRAHPEATFVSLEYQDREEEIADFDRRKGIYLHDWPRVTRSHDGQDFEDLTALVSQLDAVISVPTTVTHLAGALGVPCYCMVNPRPNVHYAKHGDKMPYYDSVRLYRRPNADYWVDVVEKVAGAL